MFDLDVLQNLAIAVAIGFLIGFEREWRRSAEEKSPKFAGARTFALIAFLGGLTGLLDRGGGFLVIAGLIVVAVITAAGYWSEAKTRASPGATTEIAIFVAYLLGAAATLGYTVVAAAGGVAAAILLDLKPAIQRWTAAISAREVQAVLRFLAISVIVLPVLPDAGYGPYAALNPRRIWWMVVLISGLSFFGYVLMKLLGSRRGVLMTGLVGGLASSTATTLSVSRFARSGKAAPAVAAAGIVMANVVMLARVAVLLSVVSMTALIAIWPALVIAGLVGLIGAAAFWRGAETEPTKIDLGNPMELKPALFFAALLAIIALAANVAAAAFGTGGLYGVGIVSGLADVDAVTLTVGGQAGAGDVAAEVAAGVVLTAVASNIAVKAVMAASIGGARVGVRVGAAFALIVAAGAAALIWI